MIYYSIPADFNLEHIDLLNEINCIYPDKKIAEVYGQITEGTLNGSGRKKECLPQIGKKEFELYISELFRRTSIKFSYTFNASCLGNLEYTKEGIKKIKNFFTYLHRLGIDRITVSSPAIIEIAKSLPFNLDIKASAICQISNKNKMIQYRNMGVSSIVLDEDITRKFGLIQKIQKEFRGSVELIVNSLCRKNCVFKTFHYNQQAHNGTSERENISYFDYKCIAAKLADENDILRGNWIRPEDILYYKNIGINRFKIQGRHAVLKGDIYKTVMCYMEEKYEGNLVDLLGCFAKDQYAGLYLDNRRLKHFIPPFLEDDDFCRDDCIACNYCSMNNPILHDKSY